MFSRAIICATSLAVGKTSGGSRISNDGPESIFFLSIDWRKNRAYAAMFGLIGLFPLN